MANRSSAGSTLGEMLLREGLISEKQLDDALVQQKERDVPLVRLLVESGALDENKKLGFFKRTFGTPIVSLAGVVIEPLLYDYIPSKIARRNHLVPVKLDKDGLVVAMEDPSDVPLLDNLKEVVGLRIKPVVANSDEIQDLLQGYPEEAPSSRAFIAVPDQYDASIKFLQVFFWPIMSMAVFGFLTLLAIYNSSFQAWLRKMVLSPGETQQFSQMFSVFLMLIVTWGIYTLVMFQISGMVFDDFQWKSPSEVGKERKKRGLALVLSIVFGFVGADRFYLGYTAQGVLKVLTLGLLGVWWVFDAVLLLTNKMTDAAGRRLE